MFGFFGFPSFEQTDVKGGIPYPAPGEKAQWGHAIVAIAASQRETIDTVAALNHAIRALETLTHTLSTTPDRQTTPRPTATGSGHGKADETTDC